MVIDASRSVERANDAVERAVKRFADSLTPLLEARIGQDEANLTAPVENLLKDMATILGLDFRSHREAADQSVGARPDLAVEIAGVPVGVVELKAPGFGVPGSEKWGKLRDRKQWEKLCRLPNVLYTDGSNWAVFHYGERIGDIASIHGNLRRARTRVYVDGSEFRSVISNFLYWKPTPPRKLGELIRVSAGLCQLLRDEVQRELSMEKLGQARPLFLEHLADWQEWLFPDLSEEEFIDSYAQTITFGLLLARREGIAFEGLEIPDIGDRLSKRYLLVGRALAILTARPGRGLTVEQRSIVLQTMRRVIGAADWSQWTTKETCHWLYEKFLEQYDPGLRQRMGAYYTPTVVADFMVTFVDGILRDVLSVSRGLANDEVVVLDPAMGTGTFLQSVLDSVAVTVSREQGDVPASLRDLLARLIGFERQIGPYAVAELKIDQALRAHSAEADDDSMRLYVADTLDDPNKSPLPTRGQLYAPLADSRRRANRVKAEERVMVIVGNPPYKTRAKSMGKWVVSANRGQRALIDDFRAAGKGNLDYKLHDLSIYFWRWALWKAFEADAEQRAGVVAFITTHGYLNSPSFSGMRRHIRQHADFGWIIDLSTEGHWSSSQTRVFPGIPHPVCISIFARSSEPRQKPAKILYTAISGSQEEKFRELQSIELCDNRWVECSDGWEEPFGPLASKTWEDLPDIAKLSPYAPLGFTCNRTWVHSPDPDVLRLRWRSLINADQAEKRILLKESRDRTIDRVAKGLPGRAIAHENSPEPKIERVGFRSFDRQYLIADRRVVDYLRDELWEAAGPKQVYLVTHLGARMRTGPAVTFSAYVPDVDCFKGHGGGRVIPLNRDPNGLHPNFAPGLVETLTALLGFRVNAEDVLAYYAALLAHGGYTNRYRQELSRPGLRVPMSADPLLWKEAINVGRRIIWLHTFGERFSDEKEGRPLGVLTKGRPGVTGSVVDSSEKIPNLLRYDSDKSIYTLGAASIGPVSAEVANYTVSGMRIVQHWFNYRKKRPSGRKDGSPLDRLVSESWKNSFTEELRDLVAVLQGCVDLEGHQAALLSRIAEGPLFSEDFLDRSGALPSPTTARSVVTKRTPSTLF